VKTKEIQEKRELFRPVAIRGSALYFTMLDMSLVSWMYNSSLDQFLFLFDESIDNSTKSPLPAKRVEFIIDFLSLHVFRYVNRGLFEKDKNTFMLMMCFKIQTTAQKINSMDIGIFLKAGASLDVKQEKARPFNFITDKIWLNVLNISRHCFGGSPVPFFKELPDSMQRNENQWKTWIERNEPENFPMPEFQERLNGEEGDLGPFMAMSLIRSIREDRALICSLKYVEKTLGSNEYVKPIAYPIDGIWASSTKLIPILMILTPGSDPTSTIEELAKKKKKFPTKNVSMGEGQEKKAKAVMDECTVSGGWVIL